MRIRFVVDSACDVPQTYLDEHQMTVIPTFVNYAGGSYKDDGRELDRHQYYQELPSIQPVPQTSAPPPGLAETLIRDAFEEADHLILLSVASTLSGTHNVMRMGAANLPPDCVTLIDSKQLSMGAGWQAVIGAEVAALTGDVAAVRQAIDQTRQRQHVYAAMQSVEYMRRGGRVGWTQAAIGNLLRIRPIVSVEDGAVNAVARVRKHSQWINKMVELIRADAPLERLIFLHSNNEPALMEVRERVGDILPANTLTTLVTPTIGTHTGPDAIGVATVRKQ